MPVRFFLGDQQRQLERLDESDLADLPRARLRNEQVLVLKRSVEDGARMPCEVVVTPLRGRAAERV
jgi:hypothetical protein